MSMVVTLVNKPYIACVPSINDENFELSCALAEPNPNIIAQNLNYSFNSLNVDLRKILTLLKYSPLSYTRRLEHRVFTSSVE